MSERMIRVVIADDHPVVREGIAAMINRREDMQVVAEVNNGREAVAAYAEYQPDVVLMDLRMPDMEGVDAIIAIREADPAARIVVLTTFDGDEDIYRAIQSGAMAYLLKDSSRQDLLDTIRDAVAGRKRIPSDVAAKLADRLMRPDLSAREREILTLVASGNSNLEIGQVLQIAEGTVKAHLNNILNKLDAADRTQAVAIAVQRGIIRLG